MRRVNYIQYSRYTRQSPYWGGGSSIKGYSDYHHSNSRSGHTQWSWSRQWKQGISHDDWCSPDRYQREYTILCGQCNGQYLSALNKSQWIVDQYDWNAEWNSHTFLCELRYARIRWWRSESCVEYKRDAIAYPYIYRLHSCLMTSKLCTSWHGFYIPNKFCGCCRLITLAQQPATICYTQLYYSFLVCLSL